MSTSALKRAELSFQQDHLWLFQREGGIYCAQCTVSIKGTLNSYIFLQSLQQIATQHTIFQTLFYLLPGMDVPIQVMDHPVDFYCPFINLKEIGGSRQKILVDALLQQLQKEPFDLEAGPLFRSAVFLLSAETALLSIRIPSLCADAPTLPLFLAEFVKRYTASLLGQKWVDEPLQYTDVSAWQKQMLLKDDEEAKAARSFWENFSPSQIKKVLKSPKNLRKKQKTVFDPFTIPIEVGETDPIHIRALAFFYDVPIQAVLLACWVIVLQRFVGELPLIVGVACHGRNNEELAEVLGLYTHFVPFNAILGNDWTFKQVLAFIGPLLEKTMKYQSYFRWPLIPDEKSSPIGLPFFPLAFEHEYWPESFIAENLSLSLKQRSCCIEPFMIKLRVLQMEEHLYLDICYDSYSVEEAVVNRIASMTRMMLHCIVEQPKATVSTFTFITAIERSSLLSTFRAPTRLQPVQQLHRLFEIHAYSAQNWLAVISVKEQLTYRQLNEQANRLARVLRKQGIGPNVLVGLYMARGAQMLVGLLGILKAGGAYLPLERGSPPAQLLYQLEESNAALLLTQREMITGLLGWERRTMLLEELEQELSQMPAGDLPGSAEAEDLAYVIYTSGATGIPRGIMIRQSSVVNYAVAMCDQLGAEPGWQYAMVSTLAANLGNTAIFCALVSGGCVQVLDYETVTSAEAMVMWVQQHPMDVLKIAPSHLSALLAGERGKDLLPRRALIIGGEVLPPGLLEQIRASGCICAVYNHYGLTETTIGVLVNPLGILNAWEEKDENAYGMIPLGKPITNTEVCVLDHLMQIVPVGVTGELYIGGAGLARGYVQQGEWTAERFVPHPYSKQAGARLYQTGDRAWYSEEEKIEFAGRRDTQVKLWGYSIELAEIERVLKQHPNVRDSVVIVQEDPLGSPCLVGYIVPRDFFVSVDMDVQSFLRQHVAEYMVPSAFFYLKFLPLTASGKVDRRRLITPDGDGTNPLPYLVDVESSSKTIVLPCDVVELHLVQIWEEILAIEPISVLDDFFQLGGHSHLAVRFMALIARQFGHNLDFTNLFHYPTIVALAVALRRQVPSDEKSVVVPIQPRGSRTPFFCVHPGSGAPFGYSNLARYLGQDQPFYGLRAPIGKVLETVEELAASYLAAMQIIQPQGPYFLGGWSAGGIIAFEIAQQLQKQGEKVAILALIDSSIPSSQMRAKVMEEELDFGDVGVVQELLHRLQITVPADFDQSEPHEQLSYLAEYSKSIHEIPTDTSLELIRRSTRMIMLMRQIAYLYVPQDYPHRIDYFTSSDAMKQRDPSQKEENTQNTAEQQDDMHAWHRLAKGGIEVHRIPGVHLTSVEKSNVQVLAHVLEQCIERACNHVDG